MAQTINPPQTSEIEISLFGPGVGECVVAHLGDGKWMIVDSCTFGKARKPIALEYLESIGVDASSSVILFVISHWDDDHIRGAFQIVETCKNATVACSAAFLPKEAIAAIRSQDTANIGEWGSGVRELHKILWRLRSRQPGRRPLPNRLEYCTANKDLIHIGDHPLGPLSIRCLSPSSATLDLALQGFEEFLHQDKIPKRRAVHLAPNEACVVLWVKIGGLEVLLGGDMEDSTSDVQGWQAIVKYAVGPLGQASIVKVPHHGSEGAYYADMWNNLVVPDDAIALIAPYTRSGLPNESGVNLIGRHTQKIFCTASPRGWRADKISPMAEAQLRSSIESSPRRKIKGPMGHLCCRMDLAKDKPQITINGLRGAKMLKADAA